MAAGLGGMEEGEQEFRVKRKGARTWGPLRSWTKGASFKAHFEGRDTRIC